MRSACNYLSHMGKMVQIRNVPESIHRTLKSRAALAGLSLSDFLLRELRQVAERPSPEELRKRLTARRPTQPDVSPADAVREERDRR
jgi:plasmid stability protein